MLGYEITEEDSTQISDILFLEEIMSLNEKLEDQSMDNLIEVQHIVKGRLYIIQCFKFVITLATFTKMTI